MKKLLGLSLTCLLLASCTVMEPEQKVVVSTVEHKPLAPFKPSQTAFKPSKPSYPGARKVAVLLPLSGQYETLGKSLLHASEMALFESGNNSNIVLLPKDTRGDVGGAHGAAREALDEGVDVIIGPIFSREVQVTRDEAQARHVPVLSFSTDSAVAGNGTYNMGFLPSQQVEHIARYAASQGHKKIVALAPKTEYGNLLSQTLQSMRHQGEIELVDMLPYDSGQLFTGSATLQQIVTKLQEAQGQGATAVLFPDTGVPLSSFVAALKSGGLHDMKILGTGQWDTPGIHQTPGLQGAWFAAPSPQGRQRFENTFQQQFGSKPPRIASLAYDATALAIALAPYQFEERHLVSPQGYSGLDGLFRLRQDGTTERGLAVMEVTYSGVETISPAVASF